MNLWKALSNAHDFFYRYIVNETIGHCKEDHYFIFQWKGRILRLFEYFDHALAALELRQCGLVEVGGAELGESRQLSILRHIA